MVVGLVLIPFGVLVLSASTWVERQTAARDAGAEAARLLVVGDPDGVSVVAIIEQIEAGYGLPDGSLRAAIPDGGLVPGQSITVAVTVEIPAMSLPVFGGVGAVDWTAEHAERFPDYGADR